MRTFTHIQYCALLLTAPIGSGAPFSNLDFEEGDTSTGVIATLSDGTPVGPNSLWIPGWQILRGIPGRPNQNAITLNLGLPSQDENSLYNRDYVWGLPIDGELAFFAARAIPVSTTSLQQTGEIPPDARSLHYNAQGGPWEVRVNGMQLDLYGWDDENTSLTFQDVSVDITPWAGQQVELRFTQTAGYNYCAIDSIRFSTEVVPEPESEFIWFLGAGWLVSAARLARRRTPQRRGMNLLM